jgi:hypothetical protein
LIDFFLQLGLASHWLEEFANSTPTAEKNYHNTVAPHTLSETLLESLAIFIIDILLSTCGNLWMAKIKATVLTLLPNWC